MTLPPSSISALCPLNKCTSWRQYYWILFHFRWWPKMIASFSILWFNLFISTWEKLVLVMYKINTYNSMINSCGHEKPLSHKACANCVLLIKTNLYFSLFFHWKFIPILCSRAHLHFGTGVYEIHLRLTRRSRIYTWPENCVRQRVLLKMVVVYLMPMTPGVLIECVILTVRSGIS